MSQEADLIRQKHSVKVNNGSGVLIQPMSPDYAYVLTAKHCLKVNSNDLNSDDIDPHVIITYDGKPITVLDIIFHDTEDMAIFIVDPDLTLELMINCTPLDDNDEVFLCGYPEDRREGDVSEYSANKYEFYSTDQNRVILTPKAVITHSNVVGFSGGGIFTLGNNNDPVLLCGIETKMDGNIDNEYHGNISVIPISEYEKLVDNPQKLYLGKTLAPLLPLHLSSFEHLDNFTFDVQRSWADDDGLNLLQDVLRALVTEQIKVSLFPYEILQNLEQSFHVHNRPMHELRCIGLWKAFLELLTISILIDKPETVDLAYVREMMKSKRLMYIGGSGVWREYIKDILFTDLEELNENSIIITQTHSKSHSPKFTNDFIKKISDKINIGRADTNSGSIINVRREINRKISKINSVIDLTTLHAECIEAKETVYEEHTNSAECDDETEGKLLTLLNNEYAPYLTIKELENED
ncbi:serine protease [Shewanella sp. 3_MG-2023]|uniref:ABC-three component system protein n=1 Tax=Shewanella sp. 3_MG-2023 TaxID=3062635 RepID=UPI0026E37D18|nr:ABC-three component system protein [Shewanella sp. 3_MG-2023]MDO6776231.1 serine protease [Shewanella sp. 3_MG-2023]